MDFDEKLQQKRVRFKIKTSDKDKHVDEHREEVREKLDETYSGEMITDHVTGFPVNNWETHIMGDPAHPCANSNNKIAAAWTAPTPLMQHHQFHDEEKVEPIEVPDIPKVQSSCGPYILDCHEDYGDISKASGKYRFGVVIERFNKWSENAEELVENFKIHMKLGGSMSETLWSKLSLGAKIVTEGGLENVFKMNFSIGPSEKLLKTSACYLSTTTGPVAGLLFISTEKLAFCSDRSLSYARVNGQIGWTQYRVAIPVGRLKSVIPCENANKPAEKYIEVVTVDNYEFWFMGFVHYQKALKYLRKAVRAVA